MTSLVVKEVQFDGNTLMAVQDKENGNIYVGVRWICQGLGLSDNQQRFERSRVQEDIVLSKGGCKKSLPTKGGNQEVLCIELRFLPLWLAKINANIIDNFEVQSKLVDYQLNAADVLAKAFLEEASNNQVLNEELETKIRIAELVSNAKKDRLQYILHLFKDHFDIVDYQSEFETEYIDALSIFKERGFTQIEVVEMTGLSKSTIHSYWKDGRKPRKQNFEKLMQCLNENSLNIGEGLNMKNVDMQVKGNILTINVDLSKDFGRSKSGKSIVIASTEGNKVIGSTDCKIGLNIYRSL